MKFIRGFLLVILAIGAVTAAAVFFIPTEKISALATTQFSQATGRELRFLGGISPSFYPTIGVKTGAIEIANAPWSDNGPMLRAKNMVIGVDLVALLRGDIKIKTLRITAPDILLERGRAGQGNWQFESLTGGGDSGGGGTLALPEFSLTKGKISNGIFRYLDAQTGQDFRLKGIALSTSVTSLSQPIALTGNAAYNGQKVDFTVEIEALAKAMAGQVTAVTVDLKTSGTTARFDGRLSLIPLAVEGDMTLNLPSIAGLVRDFELGDSDIPAGFDRLALKSQISLNDGRISLRGIDGSLGTTSLSGEADLSFAARPKLVARLQLGRLDFTEISGADGDAAASQGWSETLIDTSALGLLDAEIALTAGTIAFDFGAVSAVNLKVTLTEARLVATLHNADVFGGQAAGSFIANGRNGFSSAADFSLRQVQLRQTLGGLMGYERLNGAADVEVKLQSAGGSMAALIGALKGEGKLSVGQGEILGFDLIGMIRTLDTSFKGKKNKTVFRSITGSFTVKDGVLRNEDLRFLSPITDVAGAGAVDISMQSVNYLATATRLDRGAASGLTVPIRISGPWSKLRFTPDLDRAVLDGIGAQLGKAKADFQGQTEGRVQEVLEGVTGGKSVEELLQGEAKKALQNLLGGN